MEEIPEEPGDTYDIPNVPPLTVPSNQPENLYVEMEQSKESSDAAPAIPSACYVPSSLLVDRPALAPPTEEQMEPFDRQNCIFSPKDDLRSFSDLSQPSVISSNDVLNQDCISQLSLYGKINPDLNLELENEIGLLSNVRFFIRKAKRMLSQHPRLFPIRDRRQAEEAHYSMRDIKKISRALELTSGDLLDEIGDLEIREKVAVHLENDIAILQMYARDRLEEYNFQINDYDRALSRVKRQNASHRTRETSRILEKEAAIPLNYYENTPIPRRRRRKVDAATVSHHEHEAYFSTSDEAEADPFNEPTARTVSVQRVITTSPAHPATNITPSLPWEVPESLQRDGARQNSEIEELDTLLSKLLNIDQDEQPYLTEKIELLNNKFKVSYSINDQNLALNLKEMLRQKEFLATVTEKEQYNNQQTLETIKADRNVATPRKRDSNDEYFDNTESNLNQTSFYTPTANTGNESLYFTPQATANPSTKTTETDLHRFQREANHPSTRRKDHLQTRGTAHNMKELKGLKLNNEQKQLQEAIADSFNVKFNNEKVYVRPTIRNKVKNVNFPPSISSIFDRNEPVASGSGDRGNVDETSINIRPSANTQERSYLQNQQIGNTTFLGYTNLQAPPKRYKSVPNFKGSAPIPSVNEHFFIDQNPNVHYSPKLPRNIAGRYRSLPSRTNFDSTPNFDNHPHNNPETNIQFPPHFQSRHYSPMPANMYDNLNPTNNQKYASHSNVQCTPDSARRPNRHNYDSYLPRRISELNIEEHLQHAPSTNMQHQTSFIRRPDRHRSVPTSTYGDAREDRHQFQNTYDQSIPYPRYRSMPTHAHDYPDANAERRTQGTAHQDFIRPSSFHVSSRYDAGSVQRRSNQEHDDMNPRIDPNEGLSMGQPQDYADLTGPTLERKIRKLKADMLDLSYSTEHITRINKRLSMVHTHNFQELQDILANIENFNKSARAHRKLSTDFSKKYIDIEYYIPAYDLRLNQQMKDTQIRSEGAAQELSTRLAQAEERIASERITVANVSSQDSKEIIYWSFSGGTGFEDKNIFEVLSNHEENHKLLRTNDGIKAVILKKHLHGAARLCIPDDVNDYAQIKQILITNYGRSTDIYATIEQHHRQVGPVPSRSCLNPNYRKIAEVAQKHLTLIRRTEAIQQFSTSGNSLVNTDLYVSILMKYLGEDDQWVIRAANADGGADIAYRLILSKFNQVLATAQQMKGSDTITPERKEKAKDKTKKDHYHWPPGTSEYGMIVTQVTEYPGCEICQKLQQRGEATELFEKHLFTQNSRNQNDKSHPSDCPQYNKMRVEERIKFLTEEKLCLYCLKGAAHDFQRCKEYNIELYRNKPKFWKCRILTCPNRLELCKTHINNNKEALERKKNFMSSNQIEFAMPCLEINITNNGTIENWHQSPIQDMRNNQFINKEGIDALNTCSANEKVRYWLESSEHQADSTKILAQGMLKTSSSIVSAVVSETPSYLSTTCEAQIGVNASRHISDILAIPATEQDESKLVNKNDYVRPNMFIALRIKNGSIKEKIGKYQEIFMSKDMDQVNVIEKSKLHLTLLALHVPTQNILEASRLFFGLSEKLKLIVGNGLTLSLSGIGSFDDTIMYADIKEGNEELKSINQALKKAFEARGFYCDPRFVPHVTILKGNLKMLQQISKTVPIEENDFGKEEVKSLELLFMQKPWDEYGFYRSLTKVAISPHYDDSNQSVDKIEMKETSMITTSEIPLTNNACSPEIICNVAEEDHDRPLLVDHQEALLKYSSVTEIISTNAKPIFMYMKLAGFNRGLNTIFDSGAGGLVTLNSIPGRELTACRSSGPPVELQGLGSAKKTATKWTMLIPTSKKNSNIVAQAFSVDHILGPLEKQDMDPILKLIKNDAKQNQEVQRAECYKWLEGNIEILAGIRLNLAFPIPVHQMTNGLTLYKLRLKSHYPGKSYCIGGPFNVINGMRGMFTESANFLTEVDKGLQQWRNGNVAMLDRQIQDSTNEYYNCKMKTYETHSTKKLQQRIEEISENGCLNDEQAIINNFDLTAIEVQLNEANEPNIEHCILCCNECNHVGCKCAENESESNKPNQKETNEALSKEELNSNNKASSDESSLTKLIFPELVTDENTHDKDDVHETKSELNWETVEREHQKIMKHMEEGNGNKAMGNTTSEQTFVIGENNDMKPDEASNESNPSKAKVSLNSDPKEENQRTFLKDLNFIYQQTPAQFRCINCQNCYDCKNSDNQEALSMKQHQEEYFINKSISIDRGEKCFLAGLPLMGDPEVLLAPNEDEARGRLRRELNKLKKYPDNQKALKIAFEKLKSLNYIEKLTNMTQEMQDTINSKQKYIIPWSAVTKETSITTPCRQVYDASSKTKTGYSLNDILAKGAPKLDFDPMIINFRSNTIGLTADLLKFYNSVKLKREFYHLQCIYWTESFDPDEEPELWVIKTLTYGLKSSSRQLEFCLQLLADENKDKKSLHQLLTKFRFVDDLMISINSKKEASELTQVTNETLKDYGLKVKAWCQSYEKPSEVVSESGKLMAGGYIWLPELDLIWIRVQPLHFSQKIKGNILTNNLFIEGTFEQLNDFIPRNLTLRMVASKAATLFDPLGIIGAWKIGLKTLVRDSLVSTNKQWDAILTPEIREEWVFKFFEMQRIKEIGFRRCTLQPDSKSLNQILICFCDSGKLAKQQIVYLLHQVDSNTWHSQQIYSKSQLQQPSKTVPNQELDSLHTGAIILQKCKLSLPDVSRACLVGDSSVACHWVMKDTLQLATFQRHRVANILRLIDVDNIFHVRSELNPSDVGTKNIEPIESILPGSFFNTGPEFLERGIDQSITDGYLKPIKDLILNPANRKLASDGLAGKCQMPTEYLALPNVSTKYVGKVMERYKFHSYIVDPLKFSWSKSVRILSMAHLFVFKLIKKVIDKKKHMNSISTKWVTTFTNIFNQDWISSKTNFCETFTNLNVQEAELLSEFPSSNHPLHMNEITYTCIKSIAQEICDKKEFLPLLVSSTTLEDRSENTYNKVQCERNAELLPENTVLNLTKDGTVKKSIFKNASEALYFKNMSIYYFLKLGSKELQHFYTKSMLDKHGFKHGKLWFSKTRWLQVSNIYDTLGGDANLIDHSIQEAAPLLDRFSPVAISLAMHYHWVVSKHQGVDRSYLQSLSGIFIFQGQALFKDVVYACIKCRLKLKRRFYEPMGPLSWPQLSFGAVNRFLHLDMSGPYVIKSSINARTTRSKTANVKVWLLHSCCIVSKFSSIEVLETYGTESFVSAMHRLGCIFGYPQLCYLDNSWTEIKGLRDTRFDMTEAIHTIYSEMGINIKLCGVGGESHARHGAIERRISLAKDYFLRKGEEISQLTSLGLETLARQACAFMNSLPLATNKRIGGSISSHLITPNSFFLGRRSNTRAPGGLPQVIKSTEGILENIEKAASGMLTYFITNIPDLLLRTTWTKESTETLQIGDAVLFQKDGPPLAIKWKLGVICGMEEDEDAISRIYEIKYVNGNETHLPISAQDDTTPRIRKRFTRRGCHTICKIIGIDDESLTKELAHLNKILSQEKDPFGSAQSVVVEQTENCNNKTTEIMSTEEAKNSPLSNDISFNLLRPQLAYLLELGTEEQSGILSPITETQTPSENF